MQYSRKNRSRRNGAAAKHPGGLIGSRTLVSACALLAAGAGAWAQAGRDPLLDIMIQKGMLTQEEAQKVRAEADAAQTNTLRNAMPPMESKWKINKAVKNLEIFGDVRARYEHRQGDTPDDERIALDRGRVALRLGLRGDLYDDFYFGLRLETSTNPRSSWITLGSSSSAPFGKSGNGIALGQAYIGARPYDWVDLTVGKMPNPLYTTTMVWDSDINPEGAAEKFKYTVGAADFFANFGQFLYQDNNPSYISGSLSPYVDSTRTQKDKDTTFLLAWQGGVNYRFSTNLSAKVAGGVYNYIGLVTNSTFSGIGDAFIGEGAYAGKGSSTPVNGLASQNGVSYNQVGIDHLLVLEVPFEVNYRFNKLNTRLFGDYAYNLSGADRARAAYRAMAYQSSILSSGYTPPLVGYGPQTSEVKAYQVGFAVGNGELGLATGAAAKRHTWEFRTYWQHVEQYALDPNILDSDVFEGRGNLEGIYAVLAYGFTDNVIGTFRYGHANRINQHLGTGGSNSDLSQLNAIQEFNLFQLDLTLKF
jgi:hypothetical protein